MIEFSGVAVAYRGAPVLEDCSLRVSPGERAALTGPSGCGKTTLLRLAAGLERPERGSVTVRGRVSYAFQEPRLLPWLTAERNLALVTGRERAPEWLERAELGEAADKYPAQLSGGMRQRLNICRALACESEILLLDEPFQGLDAPLRRRLSELVARHAAGRTLLLVTHDPEDLALAETVWEYRDLRFHPVPA